MVCSRPIRSDTQPKKGRARPLSTLSTTSATVSTVPVMPTGSRRRFGHAEIGGDGGELRGDDQAARRHQHEHHIQHPEQRRPQHFQRREAACGSADWARSRRRRLKLWARAGIARRSGSRRPGPGRTTERPTDSHASRSPHWIGTTVAAAPAPKPAAVRPAARPRRPTNHFSALPTQVP